MLAATILSAHACLGAVLDVGVLSFDILIPPEAGPGVNAFSITNLTGDPATGGSALPPAFPVVSPIQFLNSSLSLIGPTGATVIPLGDLGPGANNPASLEFADFEAFASVTFAFSLNDLVLTTDDGRTFLAPSQSVLVTLLAADGLNLAAGLESTLIQIEAEETAVVVVPEPSGLIVFGLSTAALAAMRRYGLVQRCGSFS